jgi:rod shape-determining protein MreC
MKRFSYRSYVFLAVVVFGMVSLPEGTAEGLRAFAVGVISPSWRSVNFFKTSIFRVAALVPSMSVVPGGGREIEILKQENHNLRAQLELLKQYLVSEELLQQQMERLKGFSVGGDFFRRRSSELLRLVEMQASGVMAKVIFREPAAWSSSVWVNAGERNNDLMGAKVIAKNSPVVLGTSVVGVVDYVGKRKSRIRLLTDSGLTPSVRAVRGSEQNRIILEKVHHLSALLETREEFQEALLSLLKLKDSLSKNGTSLHLAKGEVLGSSQPLWRCRGLKLQGVGFNYDFADEEGAARALDSEVPILKVGDLLITTGLDGVFPAGLSVGYVTRVNPLREGASAYDIEAKAAVDDLEELSFVTIFPPIDGISENL